MAQSLVRRAADLAEAFALQAYDSVYFAAADFLLNQKAALMTFSALYLLRRSPLASVQ